MPTLTHNYIYYRNVAISWVTLAYNFKTCFEVDLIDHKNTEFSKNIFLKIYVHCFQHISQITYDNIFTLANNQINVSTTSKQNESFVYIVPWCHETNWEVTSFTARSATEAPLYNSECWLLYDVATKYLLLKTLAIISQIIITTCDILTVYGAK